MKLTPDSIIDLVTKHKDHLKLDKMRHLFSVRNGDCTNVQDCLLMYLLILENNPRHVVEFSPMFGYSTKYLASAMRELSRPGNMFTVEKNISYAGICERRLGKHNLTHYCKLISGDGITQTKNQIMGRGWKNKVDFIFIDSDHSKQFAEKYIKQVFPLLSDNCIIIVHDICGRCKNTGAHSLNFKSSLNSTTDKFSEYKAVKDFLIETNTEHTLTHPIFGGHWGNCAWRTKGPKEASPELPQNKVLYDKFEEIMGYDLRGYLNFQHPNALVFRLGEKNG